MKALNRFTPLVTGMRVAAAALCVAGAMTSISNAARVDSAKPTIVLVHGAMADSSSWNGVIPKLLARGYAVVSASNPLRGVKNDSTYISDIIKSIKGPVVLVGHSYGGVVITNAAIGNGNVKALVYVAAFAPDTGESAGALAGKYPGSLLGAALAPPVPLEGGDEDLYVEQSKFREPFAADLSAAQLVLLATTQRPLAASALSEPSGVPAWKSLPSFFIYGSADKSIPPSAQAFMAERAGARKVLVIPGASHVVMISHPAAVARLVDEAAIAVMK